MPLALQLGILSRVNRQDTPGRNPPTPSTVIERGSTSPTLSGSSSSAQDQTLSGSTGLAARTQLSQKLRDERFAIALALRDSGWSSAEIAKELDVRADTVRAWWAQARREGKLRERDLDRALDEDTAWRALEVVNEALEEGDRQIAVKVLSGRGKLRTYTNNNTEGGGGFHGVAIVYTTKDGSPVPQMVDPLTLPGQIVGRPRDDSSKEPETPTP